ncbi:precorrin-6A/cobalt-precorrin-6A reductase [Haloactinopolyspora alba]|uniref:Precorrin-6A/cobalt-precorrin-6A reductase n=1 Tax=Haloactinopolyspora alba TaxID=648780 RepID=A0A2P8EGE2_9ACTN|nr:cobalt-precorrin-6A reductase [Haloactinopolyspora alba]PSL08522.1 precorrin-6A/cobalt-precorrin-6A reductase [Haloactinopolyspora alba]
MNAGDDARRPVLVLGGTGEARALAAELERHERRVVTSLAGRVREPRLPAGEVRVGGFGGPEGLAAWLRSMRALGVVDATHPFAARIGTSAVFGAEAAGVPLVRLQRPGWWPGPGDDWHWAESVEHAARLVPDLGSRVFLTSGRQGLAAFAEIERAWFLIRCVDPPEPPLPPRAEVVLDRGPYTVDGELEVLRRHHVDVLVTKDSGGTMTTAKLAAARQLELPVLMIRRPARPPARTVETVDGAVRHVLVEFATRGGVPG